MRGCWRSICCTCDTADTDDAIYENTRNKQKHRKGKSSKKNTWTRRSLLENEHSEVNEVPYEHMAYQMKSRAHDHRDNVYTPVDNTTSNTRRRPVQEIFPGVRDNSHISKTTFPWMDEDFAPNTRTSTHLGISSVQINVKRNEIANRRSREIGNISKIHGYNKHNQLPMKSQSFNEDILGSQQAYVQNVVNVPQKNQNNVRTVANGSGYRSNVTTVTSKNNTVTHPVGISTSATMPHVLRPPSSDVGVRPRSSHMVLHHNYNNLKVPEKADKKRASSDLGPRPAARYIPNPHVINRFPEQIYQNQPLENDSNVSFSSEVTFKKSDVSYSNSDASFTNSDVSYKRSKQPGIFSSHTGKYERLKVTSSKPPKVALKKKNNYVNLTDSMYGYVPRAVQNVHASNALEGNKIDDFFLKRMDTRELETFASMDKTTDATDGDNCVIVTSLVENEKQTNVSKLQMNQAHATVELSKINTNSTRFGNNQYERVIKQEENADRTSQNSLDRKDENENKVIMIDFPPNLNSDSGTAGSASGHVVSKHSNRKGSSGSNRTENGLDLGLHSNQATNNLLLERAEVLY